MLAAIAEAAEGDSITLFITPGPVELATADRAAGDSESDPKTIAGAVLDAITVNAEGVTDTLPPPAGLIENVIIAQSIAPERSPVAPSWVLPAVATLSDHTDVAATSPPDPAVTLICTPVSPPGTVNVLVRWVPVPIARALSVSVVTESSISVSSGSGPALA